MTSRDANTVHVTQSHKRN